MGYFGGILYAVFEGAGRCIFTRRYSPPLPAQPAGAMRQRDTRAWGLVAVGYSYKTVTRRAQTLELYLV